MLDLSLMKRIKIDAERRTARAQTGLKLSEFDRETQKYGLATTLGVATTTGISGLTLGGGYGWLAGKYGLACDNLTWAQVITADGKILECSAQQNADLFWGLRGAGANFGVATELEYNLHPVSSVLGGPIFHPLGKDAFRFYDDLARNAPDELTLIGHYAAELPTPSSSIAFQQLHGLAGRISLNETAFPHRYDHHVVWVDPVGDDPADDDKMIRWARDCWEKLNPFVDRAVYVNALDDVLETGERPVREAYGANYERLRDLKTKFDPTNLFRQNSNIMPR